MTSEKKMIIKSNMLMRLNEQDNDDHDHTCWSDSYDDKEQFMNMDDKDDNSQMIVHHDQKFE